MQAAGRSWALVGEVMAHQGDRDGRETIPPGLLPVKSRQRWRWRCSNKPLGDYCSSSAPGATRNSNAECWKKPRRGRDRSGLLRRPGPDPVRSPSESPRRERDVPGRVVLSAIRFFFGRCGLDSGLPGKPWSRHPRYRITPVVALSQCDLLRRAVLATTYQEDTPGAATPCV